MIWVAYPVEKSSLVTLPCVKSGLIIAYRLFNIECKIFCIQGRVYTPTPVCQGRESGGKSRSFKTAQNIFASNLLHLTAHKLVCVQFDFQVCTVDRADECARVRFRVECKEVQYSRLHLTWHSLKMAPEDWHPLKTGSH
jgi:hypothetical protein